jgi:hypothetical protein
MTATNERTGPPRPSRPSGARGRHRRRHEDAVIQAEVRRLARALSAVEPDAGSAAELLGVPAQTHAAVPHPLHVEQHR